LDGVDVHDSIANLKALHVVWSSLRSEPQREHLLVNHTNRNLHNFLHIQLDSIIVFFDIISMFSQSLDQDCVKCIKAHFNIR
jgi:hypothetical protein